MFLYHWMSISHSYLKYATLLCFWADLPLGTGFRGLFLLSSSGRDGGWGDGFTLIGRTAWLGTFLSPLDSSRWVSTSSILSNQDKEEMICHEKKKKAKAEVILKYIFFS